MSIELLMCTVGNLAMARCLGKGVIRIHLHAELEGCKRWLWEDKFLDKAMNPPKRECLTSISRYYEAEVKRVGNTNSCV